jgi:protein phosphatase 1 regulatory subunit 11
MAVQAASSQATVLAGSSTQTQRQPQITVTATRTLVLRGEPVEGRHIAWAEDVIDNENMGKKSSKGMFNINMYDHSYNE